MSDDYQPVLKFTEVDQKYRDPDLAQKHLAPGIYWFEDDKVRRSETAVNENFMAVLLVPGGNQWPIHFWMTPDDIKNFVDHAEEPPNVKRLLVSETNHRVGEVEIAELKTGDNMVTESFCITLVETIMNGVKR